MIIAVARRLLWRITLTMTGGLQAEGELPRGGCVVVANHRSHADAAALLASIGSRHRPRIAAASDYWFSRGWSAAICRAFAAGFPVRRGGGGSGDLDAAVAHLRLGRAVVVFPEGTRSRDAQVGPFRGGAARLAAAAGVPLVPVAITGTDRLLPVHGKVHRGRVELRFGTPIQVTDPQIATETAREHITTLLGAPLPAPQPSRIRDFVAGTFAGRAGVALVATWAAAEAISWPMLPELLLLVVLLAIPRRWKVLVPAAIGGSVAGGVVAWTLAASGVQVPQPLVTEPMRELVAQQVVADGAAAVRLQPLSGAPFKVYAAQAGRAGVNPVAFALESLPARGLRILVFGLLFAGLGTLVDTRPRSYPKLLAVTAMAFPLGLLIVVSRAGTI